MVTINLNNRAQIFFNIIETNGRAVNANSASWVQNVWRPEKCSHLKEIKAIVRNPGTKKKLTNEWKKFKWYLRNHIMKERGRSLKNTVPQAEVGWLPARRQVDTELLAYGEQENC